jgi:hypothetical protein
VFYPPPPVFVGGAQPYQAHTALIQSGPAIIHPSLSYTVHERILDAWEDRVWTVIELPTIGSQIVSPSPPGGFVSNPSKASWVEPTTNTDGSPLVASEITGYQVGIRSAAGTPGTYLTLIPVTGAATLSVALPVLASGSYAAAVQAIGPVNSGWSTEATFTMAETPSPPTSFSIA